MIIAFIVAVLFEQLVLLAYLFWKIVKETREKNLIIIPENTYFDMQIELDSLRKEVAFDDYIRTH